MMTIQAMIRVLVAGDQALVRGGFRMILESQDGDLEVVGEADNGVHAVQQCLHSGPTWSSGTYGADDERCRSDRQLACQGLRTRVLIRLTKLEHSQTGREQAAVLRERARIARVFASKINRCRATGWPPRAHPFCAWACANIPRARREDRAR